ncbi:MAG: LodA/GoxA family CTQ-dependent oxidase [Cycloclasticus sp.]|nr:LodA/GoxA family CTQ-dependent oxidase [Cycloclasticus sp.]
MNKITRIRIHPGIGLTRVGNSDSYYLGPEAPGIVVDPGLPNGQGPEGGSYRDSQGGLKRQAQRYRIYGYDDAGKVVKELNLDSEEVESIEWRVHVRNMKAANHAFQGAYLFDPDMLRNPTIQPNMPPIKRKQLIIDPGIQKIKSSTPQPLVLKGDCFTGLTEGYLPGYLRYEGHQPANPGADVRVQYKPATDIEIGKLELDSKQRLIFIPGPGKAECVTTPRVELSNPSETYAPPNGPNQGKDPLTNQFAYFNVPGWWDDTCGGEIDATITLKGDGSNTLSTRNPDGTRNAANGAWVVSAPPKYSPYMYHVVSLLDRVFEAFPDAYPNSESTHFYRDVYPILSKACNYGWVSAAAAGVDPSTRGMAHGPKQAGNLLSPKNMAVFTNKSKTGAAAAARKQINAIMRYAEEGRGGKKTLLATLPENPPPMAANSPPRPAGEGPTSRGNKMPKLWGTGGKPFQNEELGNNLPNQYLSLTDWQLKHLDNWANGDFVVDGNEPTPPKPLNEIPIKDQPLALDSAALEPTIGGGFHPGIEFPYLICYPQLFEEAFRVKGNTEPGSVAAYMSSPWQGDYWSCNVAWWPVQRPDIVFSYDQDKQTRTYKEWFRGIDEQGNPLSQTDGYNQMVTAWPSLGMVLPTKTNSGDFLLANGEIVFEEFERGTFPPKPIK